MPFSLGFWANAAKRIMTWAKYNIGLSVYWRAATYCDLAADKFYVFGVNSSVTGTATAYRSTTDGITWTARALPVGKTWAAAAASPTRIVVSEINGQVYYSDNGTSWTTVSTGSGSFTFFMVWDGSRFLLGDGGTQKKIWYSSDAVTWGSVTPNPSTGTGSYIQTIAFDSAGKYMAIHQGTSTTTHLKCSSDITVAGNWTSMTMPSSTQWAGLAYGNGTWVAMRNNSALYAYSTNFGTTWTSATAPDNFSAINTYLQKIAFINDKFVYQAYDGTNWVLVSSEDGITWSRQIIKATTNRITGSAWASKPNGTMAIGVVMQEQSGGADITSDEYILGV